MHWVSGFSPSLKASPPHKVCCHLLLASESLLETHHNFQNAQKQGKASPHLPKLGSPFKTSILNGLVLKVTNIQLFPEHPGINSILLHLWPVLQSPPAQETNQIYLCDKVLKPHFLHDNGRDIGKAASRTRRVILDEMSRDRVREKWSFAYVSYDMGWKQIFPPASQLQQE